MFRDVVKLFLILPLLAGIAAFTYCWAMGICARFKWRRAKTSEATEWREHFIFYWVMGLLSWIATAATGWIMQIL